LKVRQHPIKGPYVEGLEPKTASSYEAIAALMATGERNRTVAATGMNETSSRAHTVVELTVTRVERSPCETEELETRSRVSLVDLAGSERVDGTGATGARLKEGAAINKSLSALGNCIAALAEKSAKKKKKANGGRREAGAVPRQRFDVSAAGLPRRQRAVRDDRGAVPRVRELRRDAVDAAVRRPREETS
jgi:hypothetical protein